MRSLHDASDVPLLSRITLYMSAHPVTITMQNRNLRNLMMPGIILIVLIFTLQGREADTVMPATIGAVIPGTITSTTQAPETPSMSVIRKC